MTSKKKVAHCPNCGAPIRSFPTISNMAQCEYCGSFVNVSDFFSHTPAKKNDAKKTAPIEYRPAPPAVKPQPPKKVTYKPEDYIREDQDGSPWVIIPLLLAAALFFVLVVVPL